MSGHLELAGGVTVDVRDGLVLGRVASADVVVADSKASRRHARLIAEAGVVEIEDMGSSNGTMLNGKPVDRRMLRDGDRIEIGTTKIIYREGPAPGHPTAPVAPASSGAAPLVDDELLGDGGATPPVAAPAAPQDDDLLGGDDDDLLSGLSPAPASPRGSSSPRDDVVEFEDEVVEVQKAPPARRQPSVEARSTSNAGTGDSVQSSSGRILQYSKQQGGSGLLGDDLGQMSGSKKWLLVLIVLGVGAGVVYGIMTAMS